MTRAQADMRRLALIACVTLGAILATSLHEAHAWPVRSTTTVAPAGVITGRVTDARTGTRVLDASVSLGSLSIGVRTDTTGCFVLAGIPPGRWLVTISHRGYVPRAMGPFLVAPGDTVTMNAKLEPVTIILEPIIVTATRSRQTARMVPASVSLLSSDDIVNRNPTTFDQAMETVSGVNAFRSTGGISVQSMSIRGSSDVAGGGVGNRVLLLVDGRPALTSDSGGAFWSLVPVQFIDHVEVVKGAFSSLYGSTAMGGVINVITRQPGTLSGGKLEMKLGFYENPAPAIRYTDHTPIQSELTADYSTSRGRTGFLASVSRKESGGYAENTGFELYDVYGKLLHNFKDDARRLELTLGAGHAENDYPHAWLDSAHPLEVRAAYTDDSQQKDYASADLLYSGWRGANFNYSMRTYYFHHEQRSFFNEDDPDRQIPGNEPYQLRTQIDGDKIGSLLQLDRKLGKSNEVIGGVDVQIDHVTSSPDSVMYGNQQVNNYALFAQDQVGLTRSLAATIGCRYDWNHLVGVRTLGQFSPKLGLVWTPDTRISMRALYGQAFRAPTIAEMFLKRELGGGIAFLPNPDLGPERLTLSVEAGAHWSPAARLELDAAVFRYQYEDMIYWEDISAESGIPSLYQVRNLNRASIDGVETNARLHLGLLTATANYTYVDARDESSGRADDTLPYRPRHSGSLASDLNWRRWTLHADGRYRSKIDEVFLYPLQAPAAFWVFNTALQCRLTPAWTASVKANNLLDTPHEELARYRMPGRNWLFGATVNF